MHTVLGRVRALRLVVPADAQIVVGEPREVVCEPERLIERDRVIDLPVDEQVVFRRLDRQRLGQRSVRQRHVQVRRIVRGRAEHVHVEGALLVDQRPAQTEPIIEISFRTLDRHERAAAAQRRRACGSS